MTDEDQREAAAALEALKASGVTVKRGAAARTRRPALPRYTGPPPATGEEGDALIKEIGRTYSGLSDETTAAIMHLRGEADRLADEEGPAGLEDQAPGIPEAETSTAAAAAADRGPEGLEEAPAEPTAEASAPPPARKARPVPKPTGEGLPFTLWGDVILKVYPETRGAYPIEFMRGESQLCIEAPRSPPWLSTKLQDRLTADLAAALGDEARPRDFMRRKVRETLAVISERLETDDETRRALTPAPVRRMIEETESVIVYPGEATFYEVTIAGRTLTITAAQMARIESGFINAAVLNAFPLDPLDASKNDWAAIKAYWLSPDVAEVRETEESTEAEAVIGRLRANLEMITVVDSAALMIGDHLAWFDESEGVVWVLYTRIARFIEEDLKKPLAYNSALSKMLRAAGGMPAPSKQIRGIGRFPDRVRCWGFRPEFAAFKTGQRAPLAIPAVLKRQKGGSD